LLTFFVANVLLDEKRSFFFQPHCAPLRIDFGSFFPFFQSFPPSPLIRLRRDGLNPLLFPPDAAFLRHGTSSSAVALGHHSPPFYSGSALSQIASLFFRTRGISLPANFNNDPFSFSREIPDFKCDMVSESYFSLLERPPLAEHFFFDCMLL